MEKKEKDEGVKMLEELSKQVKQLEVRSNSMGHKLQAIVHILNC